MHSVTPSFASSFRALFDGRRDAYGCAGSCVKEDVTDRVIMDHLEGRRRIGIYPLAGTNGDRVRFGCIDIQAPDWELARALVRQLGTYSISSHVERSRGGGWHVWMFFAAWVDAWKVRVAMQRAIGDLEDRVPFPLELFPRVDRLAIGTYGNFINLPLYGGEVATGRTAFYRHDASGIPSTIEFDPDRIAASANRESSLNELIENLGTTRPDLTPYERGEVDAPKIRRLDGLLPCASRMLKSGARGDVGPEWAFRLAVHFRRNGMDANASVALLAEWNAQFCIPPIDGGKLLSAVASAYSDAQRCASLGCDVEAVLPVCAREECSVWRLKNGKPSTSAEQDEKSASDIDPRKVRMTYFSRERMQFNFARGVASYRVSDLDMRRGGMRCTLIVETGGEPAYRGSANLDSDQGRRTIEKRCFEAAKLAGVANDLMNIADGIARKLEELTRGEREDAEKARQGYAMTEKENDDARRFGTEHPKILYDVVEFTSRHGLVREKRNRCLLYLMFTSRKMANPISGIGKGDSASGKSHLASTILKMFPDEDVREFTRITAAALEYRGEFSLQRKILFIREAPGSEQAEHSLRTFMSEGDLIISTVQKNDAGVNQSQDMRIRGPICFFTTTTQIEINPENETRLMQIQADESEAMTAAVMKPSAWSAEHGSLSAQPEHLRVWKNFQRILRNDEEVVVPFAGELCQGFPTNVLRARRDFARMLELIKASAYLHQFHRRRGAGVGDDGKPKQWIIASVADYAIVKQMVESSIMRSTKNIKQGQEAMVEKIVTMTELALDLSQRGESIDPSMEIVSVDDGGKIVWIATPLLRQLLGKTQRAVIQLVRSLEDEGVVAVQPNRRPLRVRIGDQLASDGSMSLPTIAPETLLARYPDDREHLYDPLLAPDFEDIYLDQSPQAAAK